MTAKPILIPFLLIAITFASACSRKKDKQQDEQIRVEENDARIEGEDSLANSITGNSTMKQIATYPNRVILTGMNDHRLVSIYKTRKKPKETLISRFSYDTDYGGEESYEHFMPGIDILYGYNLLNLAHYDLKTEKANYLFARPVLVKTLYYPSFVQDSVDKLPVSRNYYLVSVYDEDTNKDTLINKRDLRRFYYFDASGAGRIQLVPPDHSVIRSQYDPKNDIMYVFAREDENKNGAQDEAEAIHIFWFSLKAPDKAKLLY